MFEDSLVESTGRIRTRSSRFAIGSFILQAAILAVLILIPELYPSALPKQALSMLLTAPPPPPAPANLPAHAVPAHPPAPMMTSLALPSRIQPHVPAQTTNDEAPSTIGPGLESTGPITQGDIHNLFGSGAAPAPKVVSAPRPASGPVRVSAGVAAGQLIVPIRPLYPAIAKAARIQGTVVVQATISRTGSVENAHAISGPPMLIQSAITAIAQSRYRPFQLNGEPVDVETTINVIFALSQ